MSLLPQSDCAIPDETARVARTAFPKGNRYMTMRDVLGPLFTDEDFADLLARKIARLAAKIKRREERRAFRLALLAPSAQLEDQRLRRS